MLRLVVRMTGIAGMAAIVLGAGIAEAADAKKGEKVFRKCKACHKVEDGKNAVGPHLFGIVGRDMAAVDGFKYSKAMTEFGAGKTWTAEELDAFLTKPKAYIKGTKMSFGGLKKEDQRADVIAYLETLK
ncbi:MAG: cytochrome c family protein [Pseudomonadota bacterium]